MHKIWTGQATFADTLHTCEEGHCVLVTRSRADLNLRSPIRLQKITIVFEPNWKFVLEPVFLAVPIDFAAILCFLKWGCVGVHVHRGIRNMSTGFKAATMKFFMTYGLAPCDKKCYLAHKTFFHFSGMVWKWTRLPETSVYDPSLGTR